MSGTLGTGTLGSGTLGSPGSEPAVFERVAVRHEYAPDKLAIRVEPPKGQPSRWAADEHLAENVADDIRLTDAMPGGDKEGTWTLARNPRLPWPDLVPFSDISVYGPGVEEVGHYRLDKAPESDGDTMAITPAAVGYAALLDDNAAQIGPGFISGDLGKFGDPTTQRRVNIDSGGFKWEGSGQAGAQGTGATDPGILFSLDNFGSQTEITESLFDGGGVDIERVLYDFQVFAGGGSPDFQTFALISVDSEGTTFTPSTNHHSSSAAEQFVVASILGKYVIFQTSYTGVFEGENANLFGFLNPKVLGSHGLSWQGTWPNIGFTASQMLGYAVPLYTDLEANPEDLEDSGYVIQQAWYDAPGAMSAVVADITKYELLDWFVFGRKRFQLRFPGTYGRKWQAYAGPSGLQEAGLDASRLWRSIVVSYQDVDGTTRTVGPPGSGATVEEAGLELTDPDHPAVRAEITRQDLLSLNGIATAARATEAGELWLREANLLSRSGSATLSGYALDDRGIYRPVSQIRAGDSIRFPDAGNGGTDYRKIVGRQYDHPTRTASVDLDAPPAGLEALLERMSADIQALQLS